MIQRCRRGAQTADFSSWYSTGASRHSYFPPWLWRTCRNNNLSSGFPFNRVFKRTVMIGGAGRPQCSSFGLTHHLHITFTLIAVSMVISQGRSGRAVAIFLKSPTSPPLLYTPTARGGVGGSGGRKCVDSLEGE